jgi:hypothetical protein
MKIVIRQRHQDLERRRRQGAELVLRHSDHRYIDNRL